MAVCHQAVFHFCRGTVLSLHLSLSGCKCTGTIDWSDHRRRRRRLYAMHKNWWQDKGRLNWEDGAHSNSFFPSSLPLSFCLPRFLSLRLFKPFHLYSWTNQWQTSVYCLFCAQATALLQHPPLQKCFFPSVPLLITSRVTLNFLCPGRRDTSLNSHNYSSSPLTI